MKLADMPSCLEGEEYLIKTEYGLTTNWFCSVPKDLVEVRILPLQLNIKTMKEEEQEKKIDELIDVVCEVLKINYDDLISPNQKRVYTEARMIVADVILDRFTRYTLKRVGQKLGGRAHSTMINSMRTYKDLYKVDKEFRGKVLNVKHYTNGI